MKKGASIRRCEALLKKKIFVNHVLFFVVDMNHSKTPPKVDI